MPQPMYDSSLPPLRMPGATLITRLKVYDTPGPDGQRGGTPHVHLLCTELYFVLAGSGAVELLDHDGFSRVELRPQSALVFSPGTIHRLINPGGDLELLVMMQNSGLPERGDNVVTLPDAWMDDDARFAEAMHVETLQDATRRRDRGVEGFVQLVAQFDAGPEAGRAALEAFYQRAAARTAGQRAEWDAMIAQGAEAAVTESRAQLTALQAGQTAYLHRARHHLIPAADATTPGFCGHLNRYFDPATLHLEGRETS